ncbi:hypothetical protein B0T14DRAFT_570510 [Immersiella caudata]|uniref:Uncharacterized protein n=1 Tax=Immersiella caudata TaxID=314043 RepID=A0AA40BUX3_9PEZI|nr:hypothetical protein B0T14DRAFT_570510 [Immersiella caudata]
MTELNDNTPVFCAAEIPPDLLNEFFLIANNAPEFAAEGVDDVGVLISATDIPSITQPTKPPVPPQTSFPFLDKTPEEVWDFAQEKLGGRILNRVLAILDEGTLRDKTCLLVTRWENPPEGEEGQLLKVRSRFVDALVVCNLRNLGIGGDEHFRGLFGGS